ARSGAHGVVGMAEEAIQAVRARGARLPSGTRTTIARAAAVLAGLAPVRDAIVAARHLAALGLTELAHTVQVAPADLIRTAFLRAGAAAVDVRLVPIRDAIVAGRLLAGAREADLALAVAARFAAEPGDAARTVAATVDVGFVAVQDAVVTARLGAPALDARAARAVVVLRAELAGRAPIAAARAAAVRVALPLVSHGVVAGRRGATTLHAVPTDAITIAATRLPVLAGRAAASAAVDVRFVPVLLFVPAAIGRAVAARRAKSGLAILGGPAGLSRRARLTLGPSAVDRALVAVLDFVAARVRLAGPAGADPTLTIAVGLAARVGAARSARAPAIDVRFVAVLGSVVAAPREAQPVVAGSARAVFVRAARFPVRAQLEHRLAADRPRAGRSTVDVGFAA